MLLTPCIDSNANNLSIHYQSISRVEQSRVEWCPLKDTTRTNRQIIERKGPKLKAKNSGKKNGKKAERKQVENIIKKIKNKDYFEWIFIIEDFGLIFFLIYLINYNYLINL